MPQAELVVVFMGKVTLSDGGWCSVVRASGFQSEDPGFDPLMSVPGWGTVFLSPRVNSCADLFVPEPPCVCTARTHMCAHVKDTISICRKRVGLTAGGIETRKHCTQKEKKKLGRAVQWLFAFPGGKSSPNLPCIALGTRKLSSLIECNRSAKIKGHCLCCE